MIFNIPELDYKLLIVETAKETEELLILGANPNAKDCIGIRPLMRAKSYMQSKILIDYGAKVNALDRFNRTALMFNQNPEQIILLVESGADINAMDKWGMKVMFNPNKHTIPILHLLMDLGADLYAEDKEGRNLLKYITDTEVRRWLIDEIGLEE